MAGYILVDIKTKKTVAVCSAIALVLFIVGILIGFFSGKHAAKSTDVKRSGSVAEAIRSECSTNIKNPVTLTYFARYVKRHNEKNVCVTSPDHCLDFGLPRHYIAYHMNGRKISVDGKLDDKAWEEVPWSEDFVDMRSEVYPAPYLDTRFKMRWDDERLYIGAYIQENRLWATYDIHDSPIYKENGFEVLMDVDGTLFNYKQLQINAKGTEMDILYTKSPHDQAKSHYMSWDSQSESQVNLEGTLNDPADEDRAWTVEWAIPFQALNERSSRVQVKVREDEVWFMQFGRSEQKLNVTDGKYERIKNSKTDWWSWQPCDAINLHLQDRWGLVQFKTDLSDKQFNFQMWHVYKSLFDMMNGMKKYKALNGRYTKDIRELDVPPYLLMGACVEVPDIEFVKTGNKTDFLVTVSSKLVSHKPAHIRSDRFVSFY